MPTFDNYSTMDTDKENNVTTQLREDILDALKDPPTLAMLRDMLAAVAKTVEDDEDTSGEDIPKAVELTYVFGETNSDGFTEVTVEALRPDPPPPPPEPVVEPEPAVSTGDVPDKDNHPKPVNGVRPAEDTSIYQPSRWSQYAGDSAVIEAIVGYTKWLGARTGAHTPSTTLMIDSKVHVAHSLTDWVVHIKGRRMSKAQVRTVLKRLEEEGSVIRNGKLGKQVCWAINPNGAYGHRI